jgi:phosphate:Na+ symporter
MMQLASISSISIVTGLLQVLGSLGVFLFGMKVMSESVQRLAGKRMREALAG